MDKTIKVWKIDMEDKKITLSYKLPTRHTLTVCCLLELPSNILISGCFGGVINFWNLR